MARLSVEQIVEQKSSVIAARLIAELVNQPDGDAMIARAMEVFHDEIRHGIAQLIDRLEVEFEFSMDGLEMMAADGLIPQR
jgi:hypothetical protein